MPVPPTRELGAMNMDERVLHAHIECSQGVSTYCILEAALSIARDLGAQHRWIDELEDIMPKIFPGMLQNCYLRDTGNGKVAAAKVRQRLQGGLCLVYIYTRITHPYVSSSSQLTF